MQSGSSQDLDKRTGSTSSTSNDERAVKLMPGLYNTSSAEYMRWAKEGREVLGTPSYTVYSMLESEKKRLDTGDEVVLASPRESRLVCGLVLEHQRTSVSLFTDRFDSIPISTTFYRLHASKKEPIICYQQTV
ncbi:hypothetical protein PRIPAC_96073 [Pristionchus pacificus]|uniref:Uncharacterized protein n=1 Tax=Pristionchus pacificus TaxID=54126 RepID=A0A454XY57_PRIPA|nr:hypothetical protein PRIPAC_96073 [Pristionchus pacificus]|eukprot:PDM60144.1 hypothetical protein PRIPAC_49430 [Pristionchus pacificus]